MARIIRTFTRKFIFTLDRWFIYWALNNAFIIFGINFIATNLGLELYFTLLIMGLSLSIGGQLIRRIYIPRDNALFVIILQIIALFLLTTFNIILGVLGIALLFILSKFVINENEKRKPLKSFFYSLARGFGKNWHELNKKPMQDLWASSKEDEKDERVKKKRKEKELANPLKPHLIKKNPFKLK